MKAPFNLTKRREKSRAKEHTHITAKYTQEENCSRTYKTPRKPTTCSEKVIRSISRLNGEREERETKPQLAHPSTFLTLGDSLFGERLHDFLLTISVTHLFSYSLTFRQHITHTIIGGDDGKRKRDSSSTRKNKESERGKFVFWNLHSLSIDPSPSLIP